MLGWFVLLGLVVKVDSGVEEAALGTLLQTVEALLEEMGEGNGYELLAHQT